MRTVLRTCWPPVVAVTIGLLTLSQPISAQPKKSGGDAKALDKAAYDSLGAVINHGADLFNNYGDYAGCYHAYRGGLIAVRPFLAHRPDLQKAIDDGLAGAEERRRVTARAFALRQVLGDIRKQVAPGAGPVTAKVAPEKASKEKIVTELKIKKIETTRPPEKKVIAEKKASPPAPKMARVSGKVTYKGQPVAGGWYVTLVSATDKHTFSTYIRADGTYTFKTPLPEGTYTIAIEEGPRDKANAPARMAVPTRYQNPVTSGLTFQVQAGTNALDLNLQ